MDKSDSSKELRHIDSDSKKHDFLPIVIDVKSKAKASQSSQKESVSSAQKPSLRESVNREPALALKNKPEVVRPNETGKQRFQSISEKSKVFASHKESYESGGMITEQLGESILPPQMFDNSTMLFSNAKKNNRENVKNHLQSDIGKSENEVDFRSVVEQQLSCTQEEGDGEGEDNGEGESYTSSCSCSSCLREKNADNAVSLKLSQFSYQPAYSNYQKESEDNRSYADVSNYQEDNTSGYELSKGKSNAGIDFHAEYPDNLNNGKFRFQIVSDAVK